MSSPFDDLAENYAELWSDSTEGAEQRSQVWFHVDPLFSSGDSMLDLGCGPGDDAVHMMRRGVRVTAIDASRPMVEQARQKSIDVLHTPIEEISKLPGPFDGALSNFGALNCVQDPTAFARDLAELLREGAPFALCVLSRFYWRESLRYALRLNFAKAVRRWSGHSRWRGIDIYYRGHREWTRAMAPHFSLVRRVAIGGGDHTLYIFKRAL
ncbi:MAG: class I SAM-dependent methyltransferase [Bryobacteraceae bacterium]